MNQMSQITQSPRPACSFHRADLFYITAIFSCSVRTFTVFALRLFIESVQPWKAMCYRNSFCKALFLNWTNVLFNLVPFSLHCDLFYFFSFSLCAPKEYVFSNFWYNDPLYKLTIFALKPSVSSLTCLFGLNNYQEWNVWGSSCSWDCYHLFHVKFLVVSSMSILYLLKALMTQWISLTGLHNVTGCKHVLQRPYLIQQLVFLVISEIIFILDCRVR